jgi:hypothetical protein
MTLSRRITSPWPLRARVVRKTTRAVALPIIRVGAKTRHLLAESAAWLMFAAVSLLGWLVAAMAFGFI